MDSIPELSGSIQSKLDALVKAINEGLNVKTSRAKSSSDCVIYDPICAEPLITLKASEDAKEVTIDQFSKILGRFEEGISGSYCPKTGKIFLIKSEWCYCNLIHEALHSRSTFSKTYPPPKNLEFVYEGITELLVGLVLKRRLPECYRIWQLVDSCFLEPYAKFVKPWMFLTFKTDFDPIIILYFNLQEKDPYVKLGKLLQEFCDASFENVFLDYNPWDYSIFDRFLDELGELFPMDFAEFQRSPLVRVNLDHLGQI